MESEQIPTISSPWPILVSAIQATANKSRNWRDTYDPFGFSTLNPHNMGATAAEDNVEMAQTSLPFTSWALFGSFEARIFRQTTIQSSGSREQQST